ncbi:hypothetical protein FIBSPDRAFT_836588 [Athelia psychrophila]|uniref:RGS domain-containing protein n=1 Tax=Athelia psychrophila TaxID=1759441 RepID=A0A166AYQ4_9AGAM|nr:hypothetical protein FIBSPDRAFT_836588 [Fibularhizoctonia sp. CBS 109695]
MSALLRTKPSLEVDESYQTVDEEPTHSQIPSPNSYRKARIQYPKKMKEMALRVTEGDESDVSAEHHWSSSAQPAPSIRAPSSTAPRRIIGPTRTARALAPPSSFDDRAELSDAGTLHYKRSDKGSLRGYDSAEDITQPWAQAQVPGKSTLPHLPDWNPMANGGRSALPNSHIQRNMDYSMRKLMNEGVFKDLMMDPLGRHRFREFMGETAELDLWTDTFQAARFVQDWKANAEALHDLYMTEDSEHAVALPSEVQRELMMSLRAIVTLDSSFDMTQRFLLHKMYNDQFQGFVKHKIIQEMQVKLGKHNLSAEDQEGLGDCFCLTDPRLPDHPIVLVSEGFIGVTGYPKSQIVGRNCRFLQGPGTSPESVQRIRDGLNSGEGCTELLLNYRRDGEPFYCLLCILPLRDATGEVAYFIGGQTNVTGILADHKNLGFLIGGDNGMAHEITADSLSPTMAHWKQAQAGIMSDAHTVNSLKSGKSTPAKRKPGAAGTQEKVKPRYQGTNQDFLSIDPSPPTPTSPRGNVMSRLFNRTAAKKSNQTLATGADNCIAGESKPIEDQFTVFRDTYSKLILFKKDKREIMFVTPQMLRFLGLPCGTRADLYNSPLIHCDIVSCLTVGEKSETKQMHKEFKNAIKANESISIMCGVRYSGKTTLFGRKDHTDDKFGVMHVTPLLNKDNVNVAFVAIFG